MTAFYIRHIKRDDCLLHARSFPNLIRLLSSRSLPNLIRLLRKSPASMRRASQCKLPPILIAWELLRRDAVASLQHVLPHLTDGRLLILGSLQSPGSVEGLLRSSGCNHNNTSSHHHACNMCCLDGWPPANPGDISTVT